MLPMRAVTTNLIGIHEGFGVSVFLQLELLSLQLRLRCLAGSVNFRRGLHCFEVERKRQGRHFRAD